MLSNIGEASGRARIGWMATLLIAYCGLYFLLFPIFGRSAATFQAAPIMLVAWWWGIGPGVLMSVAVALLDAFVLFSGTGGGMLAVVREGGAGHVATLFLAIVIGWVRQLTWQVRHELTQRERAEAALRQAHDELEMRVAERTAELSTANEELTREIAERKRLEAQLLQAQKMESIGRLAGGVAHDFNNLLTVIRGYTDIVLADLSSEHPSAPDLEAIRGAAERASGLTRQLLAFARKQIIEPRALNLNDLILDIDRLLRRVIGEDIELVTRPAPDLGMVNVDYGQLEQVLLNLAVNARDAMPTGGKLTIETQNVILDRAYNTNHLDVVPGPYILLAVSDTGTGMTPEVQAQIFEPFFTTKEQSKGTGLGLAMCYGIVRQHQGYIWVYSEVGEGTTFKIYLPEVEVVDSSPSQIQDSIVLTHSTETILLVEDEASVRELAARVLRGQGCTVLEATHGSEALRVASELSGTIDLLLSDVVLPQMSGKALAEHLEALYPALKVVFMSGYTDNAIVHHGRLDDGVQFIQKPFTPDELVRKIRSVLDAQS